MNTYPTGPRCRGEANTTSSAPISAAMLVSATIAPATNAVAHAPARLAVSRQDVDTGSQEPPANVVSSGDRMNDTVESDTRSALTSRPELTINS